MIWQYLTEDVKGAASKKEYGKQGERVAIITHSLNMRLVINEKGNKFWVNENQLTNVKNQKK
jgi:hypothetical protein